MAKVVEVDPEHASQFEAVRRLGDSHRGTLGFMPEGAFRHMAAKGHLLAAFDGDELAGYALYDIAKMRVRLIHLCVDEHYRRKGVAKLLISHLSDKHKDLTGIIAKCRRDFPAHHIWPSLGFGARTEVPGRGKDGATLVVWWMSHGLPDLFSQTVEEDTTTIVIDRNIAVDLTVERDREGAAHSRALEADWLSGQLRLAITPEVRNEVQNIDDPAKREQHIIALSRFQELDCSPTERSRVEEVFRRASNTFRMTINPIDVTSSGQRPEAHTSSSRAIKDSLTAMPTSPPMSLASRFCSHRT